MTTTWNRTARKTYRHESGIVVIYRPNTWDWEIIGGAQDGYRYERLHIAQHYATAHLAVSA